MNLETLANVAKAQAEFQSSAVLFSVDMEFTFKNVQFLKSKMERQ